MRGKSKTMSTTHDLPHPPDVSRLDFNCPHCGAHANQRWFTLLARAMDPAEHPNIPDAAYTQLYEEDDSIEDEVKEMLREWCAKMQKGQVFLESSKDGHRVNETVYNLHLSRCFSCQSFAVWLHGRLLFPRQTAAPAPNADMPDDVRADFEEARQILDLSPRGSAALLRLCIQKLCEHLGESGKNLDRAIGSLVTKGLDKKIQQSLDVVRVVGNNAVHPGEIDVADSHGVATTLFSLVNLIAYRMVSEPKAVQAAFESLPESARKQIEKRDGGANA
jgi:hypothetical protein